MANFDQVLRVLGSAAARENLVKLALTKGVVESSRPCRTPEESAATPQRGHEEMVSKAHINTTGTCVAFRRGPAVSMATRTELHLLFERLTARFRSASWISAILVAAMAMVAAPSVAEAKKSKYASMAYDANTGNTLFETFGSAKRYPASLTKIMTLYIVFDLIEKGRLSYNSRVPISAQAAAQPPSKLGFKVGESIRIIDAIKALVTKSANDVAVAVAERVAGSEARFARLMTKTAREIGMKNTVFKNASGLPDSGQVTTAHDMVKLALRIQDDFPKQYKLFKTRYFTYRGKKYKNHNTLLGRVKGVDGIKTGYIRASGFNLVSSVKRDGKHVVAVVFGGKTARRRNAHMRSIIARALKQASTRKTRKPQLVARPRPAMRPIVPEQKPLVDQRTEFGSANNRKYRRPTVQIAKVRKLDVTRAAEHSRQQPSGPLQDQLAALLARSGIDDLSEAQEQGSAEDRGNQQMVQRNNGEYQIQVGAYASRREARAKLRAVARRAEQLLYGYSQRAVRVTVRVSNKSRTFYRARFAGFDSNGATATCTELRRRSIDCFVAGR